MPTGSKLPSAQVSLHAPGVVPWQLWRPLLSTEGSVRTPTAPCDLFSGLADLAERARAPGAPGRVPPRLAGQSDRGRARTRETAVYAPRLTTGRRCVMSFISRGFHGRRPTDVDPGRVPPGQYVTTDYPVLSAGPTQHTPLDRWDFRIVGEVDEPRGWTWEEFRALPNEEVTRDIHCVTKWTK